MDYAAPPNANARTNRPAPRPLANLGSDCSSRPGRRQQLLPSLRPPYGLSAKILFITGLLKAWKFVYVLFLIIAFHHAIVFLGINIMGTAMNLLLAGLAISARRYYFPK